MSTGSAIPIQQEVSHIVNGISTDIYGVSFPLTSGVTMPQLCVYNLIPPPTVASSVGYFLTTAFNGGVITLNTANTSGSGILITEAISFNGNQAIKFANGLENSVWFSPASATVTGMNVTITGYDYCGVAVSEVLTINAGSVSGVIQSNKTYWLVTSITFSANPGVNVQIGNGYLFGLPYMLRSFSNVINAWWNNAQIDPTLYMGPANPWRSTAPNMTAHTPDTLTTSARGVIKVPSTAAPNGVRLLSTSYYVYGANAQTEAELTNLNQSTLTWVGVQRNASNTAYVAPSLTEADLTGLQYPGDLPFINAYQTQKAT